MRYHQIIEGIEDPEFKSWFGNSKVVNAAGIPIIVYHQTSVDNVESIEANGFDIERLGARASDEQMPNGIFFKRTTEDIGVGGRDAKKAQMPFFLSIQKPLYVNDRDDLHAFLSRDASYQEFARKVKDADHRLAQAYEKLMDRSYISKREPNPTSARPFASAEHYDIASQKLNFQCTRYLNKVAAIARQRATEVLKAHGHDGLWMKADKGGGLFGNRFAPETIVVFDKNQVRSAKVERQAEIDRSWGRAA
jgi:hypothetical protein